MSDKDIKSPFNACQHREYCRGLSAELTTLGCQAGHDAAMAAHYRKKYEQASAALAAKDAEIVRLIDEHRTDCLRQGKENSDLFATWGQLVIENARMRQALEQAEEALNTWVHTYASDYCDPKDVEKSVSRLMENGTVYYIADKLDTIRQARAALSQPSALAEGK